jgi:hypothetical protein
MTEQQQLSINWLRVLMGVDGDLSNVGWTRRKWRHQPERRGILCRPDDFERHAYKPKHGAAPPTLKSSDRRQISSGSNAGD